MIVNEQVNEQQSVLDPDPKVNIQKAKDFIIKLYKDGGKNIDEKRALRFASDPNLKNNISNIYRRSGNYNITPKDKGLSIYNSFLYEEESNDVVDEKKNPDVKKNSELPGTSLPGSSPLPSEIGFDQSFPTSETPIDPDQQEILQDPSDNNGAYFDFSKGSYKEIVYNIPQEIFTQDEGYVVGSLSGLLDDYGVTIKESGIFNQVIVTNAKGESKEFDLFTDAYKTKQRLQYLTSGLSEDEITQRIEDLEKNRFGQFQQFLASSFKGAIDFNYSKFSNTDINDLPQVSSEWFGSQITPNSEDMRSVVDFLGTGRSITEYYGADGFNQELWESDLQSANKLMGKRNKETLKRAKKKLRRSGSGYGERDLVDPTRQAKQQVNELKQKISGIITRYNDRKEVIGEDFGNILNATGKYKEINLNDANYLNALQDSGMNISDMPLDAIKINGKASSLNDLTKKLYDFNQLQEVRKGNIKIDIDDPNKAGLLKGYVQQAKELIRTQEATRNGIFGWQPKANSYAGGILNWMNQSYENVENFVQGAGFSAWELGVNTAYIAYDSLKGMGVDEKLAEAIVYGQTGLPGIGNFKKIVNPEFFNRVKSEYIPVYGGDLTKSQSAGEFVSKLVDPIANSMASTGAFILNPAFGLSLVGVTGYGGNLQSYDQQIKSIKEKKAQGLFLTEEEVNLESMSNTEKRLTSLLKSGVEVGFTSLFTFKYFKSLKKAIPKDKTSFDVNVFSKQYSKQFKEQYVSMFSKLTGIDKKLLLNELSEEQLIAFTNYGIDVLITGTEKFDKDKAIELFVKTGFSTLGSTKGISSALKFANKRRLKKAADGLILNNLAVKGENEIHIESMLIESQIKAFEDESAASKTSLDGNVEYESLIKRRGVIDSEINKFEKRKKQLLNTMSQGDKISFIDKLATLEEKNKIFQDPNTTEETRRLILDDLDKIKKEIKDDLSKYPSELSYYFADDTIKLKYDGLAIKAIQEEKIQSGETSFTIDSQDPKVKERASKLYYEDMLENKKEFNNEVYAFGFQGLSNKNNDINNFVEDSEVIGFDLNSAINQQKGLGQPVDSDQTQTPLEDDLELNKEEKDDDKKAVVIPPVSPTVIQPEVESVEDPVVVRKRDILEKLDLFNVDGNFLKTLPITQQKVIQKYFYDLKKGKIPQYGNVESILKSHEIATRMAADFSEKIKLSSSGNNEGMALNLLAALNNMSQNIYAGQLTGGVDVLTADVLMQMIVKDNVKGKPFYDLVQESLRSTAEPQNKSFVKLNKDYSVFEQEVLNYNKLLFQNAAAKGEDVTKIKAADKNPNSLVNSYEQFILASLLRKTGKIDPKTGLDTEFVRIKGLILQERNRAKEEYENKKEKAYKDKYETWNSLIEKLDIENATSYSDISSKAFSFNVNAVERMRSMFEENYEGSVSRIRDHENGDKTFFKKGSYIPMFMRGTDSAKISDFFGENSQGLNSSPLKDNTGVTLLDENMRLSPGSFFNSVYSANRGVNMEIGAYKNWQTLDNLLDSKVFNNLFEQSNQKDRLFNALKKRKQFFYDDVRRTNMKDIDITSSKGGAMKILNDVVNTAYGSVSVVSLGRWSQGISQYASAVTGSMPLLRNTVAKQYVQKKNVLYTTFTNALTNKTATDGNIKKRIQGLLGSKDLQNLYSKSRTGFRNSILSELAIDQNQSLPADYYAGAFNIDKNDPDFKSLFSDTARYTFDQVINVLNTSNNLSLNLWLANADKLAANNVFEAHYLDYKVSKGEKLPKDMKLWWAEQNKNPDLEAIRHADFNVGLVMRQTDAVSEAALYQQNQSDAVKSGIRMAIPFQKFILNAKADITNQISILLDPTIPEEQKDFAKKRLQGRVREVMSFNIIKQTGRILDVAGIGAGLAMALGVDEDDIEEFGATNKEINEEYLPITSDSENFDFRFTLSQTTDNIEDYNKAVAGYKSLFEHSKRLNKYTKKYENKSVPKKNYSAVESVMKDLIFTMNPLPRVGLAEDGLAILANETLGTNISEFSSSDIDRSQTTNGFIRALSDNLGMASIGKQQYDALTTAAAIYDEGLYKKDLGDFGTQTYYLTAQTPKMREALKQASIDLYRLRLMALTLPGTPRADLDKIADGIERSIDKYFSSTTPDPKYLLLLEGGPMTEESYEESALNQMKKAKE